MNRRDRRARNKSIARGVASMRDAAVASDDPGRLLAIADQLLSVGKPADAKAVLKRARALAPSDAGVSARLAYAFAATGDLKSAERLYRDLSAARPTDASLLTNHAILLQKVGRLDEAKETLKRALDADPTHANALYHYASMLSETREREEAVRAFNAAIVQLRKLSAGTRPDLPDILVKLANAELWVGNAHAAVEILDRALSLRPEHALAAARRGLALAKLRRYPEAIASLKRAATTAKGYAEASRAIGELLMEVGEYSEAARHLRQALRNKPQDQFARYLLAGATGEDIPEAPPAGYVEALFDEYAATFDRHLVEVLKYRAPEQLCAAVLEAAGAAAANWKAIDLGCGTGLCGPLIRPATSFLIGVDRSAGMLDKARERGVYDQLERKDLVEALLAYEEELDLAISADVLLYIGNLEPTFRACAPALKPGGLFAFTCEAHDGSHYVLGATGRYQHSRSYLDGLARESGFVTMIYRTIIARYQDGNPVQSHLYVLRREISS